MSNGKPARWWIGTIPYTEQYDIDCRLSDPSIKYCVGQREKGSTGYEHYQLCVNFSRPVRLSGVKKVFGKESHWEPTRSDAAVAYCQKSDTAIPGTQFEHGRKPMLRNSSTDWEAIKNFAKSGDLESVPPDVYVRCYQQLRRIESDNLQPVAIERKIWCFWGATGSGKSRRAWSEAGLQAYPKDPRSKFWDGYRGQEHVVIDEFRGGIDISHVLRWLDRYPVIVEVKGSSTVLKATTIWITSNLNPRLWYPELDEETVKAMLRRMQIVEFVEIKSG